MEGDGEGEAWAASPLGRGMAELGARVPFWAPASSLAPASWRLGPPLSVALPFSRVIATHIGRSAFLDLV